MDLVGGILRALCTRRKPPSHIPPKKHQVFCQVQSQHLLGTPFIFYVPLNTGLPKSQWPPKHPKTSAQIVTWGLFQKKPSHEEETYWFLPFPRHLSLGLNNGTFFLKSMLLGLVSFSSQAEISWGQQPTQILTPPGPHPKCSNSVTQVLFVMGTEMDEAWAGVYGVHQGK